jgi:hypothetical protein
MKSWLIHESLIEETVLSKEETLISGVHDKSVVDLTRFFEVVKNLTNALINSSNGLHVVSHEFLINFDIKSLSSEVLLVELVRDWLVKFIPFLSLSIVESVQEALIGSLGVKTNSSTTSGTWIRLVSKVELEVIGPVLVLYFVVSGSRSWASSGVGIKVSVWKTESFVLEMTEISGRSSLVSMWSLVVHHHHPWLIVWNFVLKNIQDDIGDFVSNVGVVISDLFSILDEVRLIILTLTDQDVPVVETTVSWLRVKVIFTNDASVVTMLLHLFWISPLSLIKSHVIVLEETVDVAVFGSDNNSSGRTAQRVGDEGIVKSHTFIGDSVDIWSLDMNVVIGTDGFESMIIRHHKEDVGSLVFSLSVVS